MEFVENDRLLRPLEVGNNSLIAMQLHPHRPRTRLARLGKSLRIKFLIPAAKERRYQYQRPAQSLGRNDRARSASVVTERRIAAA